MRLINKHNVANDGVPQSDQGMVDAAGPEERVGRSQTTQKNKDS